MHKVKKFPCPAYFLCLLPVSLPCLISLPRLLPFLFLAFPACFLALPIASAFCLFPCPAYFCALPFSLPCLLPCPTYRSTFLYECTLHGYIASISINSHINIKAIPSLFNSSKLRNVINNASAFQNINIKPLSENNFANNAEQSLLKLCSESGR